MGVDQIHSIRPVEGYRTYSGIAAGTNKRVEAAHYSEIGEPMALLKQRGFTLIAAGLSATAVDYRELDYTQAIALVLGAEREGVSEQAQKACDIKVTLPMHGMVESYNVSVVCR